jgi:hypothetical protein
MPIDKPLPLMVGNKAYYTLTSYEPVEIEVDVPYTSEDDVDYALEMTLREIGGQPSDLDDPAWVAEHFNGLTTRQQVRDAMRQQVSDMNVQMAEEQKMGKCVEALSTRLCQSIPPQLLEQARQAVQMRFTQQLQADGMTPAQFLARTHTTSAQLEAMFDRQAQVMAEGDAALSAYAHEKKLKVDELEYARLLRIPQAEAQKVIDDARAAGQLDQLRDAALSAKAAQIVVAECSCTYNHETPQAAKARIAQYRQMQQMFEDDKPADQDQGDGGQGRTGFKLV